MAVIIMPLLILLIALFCVVMLVRGKIIYRANPRAINIIYDQDNWSELRPLLVANMRMCTMFSFRKWTFKDFYPELVELEKK